ncbi:polysaccharide biosynthesis tyrosine autokinase [Halobacillus fulvus]|nr:polysaccharide biosynthesis tyrosine autokinase [Halobacillus fulvus]
MFKSKKPSVKRMQKLRLSDYWKSTEQIRMIRAHIEQEMAEGSKCLMVTSPEESKDRSLIVSKLSMAFAEQGKKVLLVDANVRSPSLHYWFQVDNLYGWTTALLMNQTPDLYIQDTFQPRLSLLTAGHLTQKPSRVWISDKIKEWVQEMRQDFDLILFETPPLLSVADPQILMNHCDGVILVACSNQSKREEIALTKHTIDRANKPTVGVILQTG